jgi:formate dehydrogenase major subunit
MAECHPVGFQWVTEAKERGARVIHVDPRFTRTSALADTHVPIRAGSDIAFLGAIVNYILSNEKYFKDYVLAYTNASHIIDENFRDVDDLDGVFSGYDAESGKYDPDTWSYAGMTEHAATSGPTSHAEGEDEEQETRQEEQQQQGRQREQQDQDGSRHGSGVSASGEHAESESSRAAAYELGGHGAAMGAKGIRKDETLQDPQCVFQILRRHFARYTPEMVQEVCGVTPEQLLDVCQAVTANSGRDRTTAWVYSVGWTHHTVGIQYIRTAAIIQLLLGNIGRPGGGIMALRGHASIQGSTDIPTLYNLLPGYLPMPMAGQHHSLDAYVEGIASPDQKGYWANARTYIVNLLKAWWGDAATEDNQYCFDYLPTLTGDHGTYATVMAMLDDKIDGYFLFGQNPAVGSAHGKMQRLGLARLKWLVVRDFNMIESATFWKDSPEIETGELKTSEIDTEVFFLPAAAHTEKSGSFTQTQRMLQWHHKAVEPPGDCQSDLDFVFKLGRKIRQRLAGSTDDRDRPILDLTWDYETDASGEVSADSVLREINGEFVSGEHAGSTLASYQQMADDGSTTGGGWIYTGVYADGVNQAARRRPGSEQSWVAPEWGWAWPSNRRILYNRASADPEGRPWSERKAYLVWDEQEQKWTGPDIPDFEPTKAPSYRPAEDAKGPDALAGDDPFVMQADGKGWLYAPSGLLDGPLPAHYEPQESPFSNAFYTQQSNPAREVFPRPDNLQSPSGDEPGADVFPYVFTTYRLTEHHTAGGMSRFQPYLSELQPEFFCEISPELAAERGLEHLGWATIVSPRTAIEARVIVTERMVPLQVAGRATHQVGLPYHWGVGQNALVSGDSANDLFGVTLDPNVHIQESKVASCDIRPGRRPRGPALLELVAEYRRRAGITTDTGNARRTPSDSPNAGPRINGTRPGPDRPATDRSAADGSGTEEA